MMNPWKNKQIAIAGFGQEGKSVFKFLRERGAHMTVLDESEETARTIPEGCSKKLGEGVFDDLSKFDAVVRSPGIDPSRLKHHAVTSLTNIFFENCPATIIGITGSKGKGTTATLTAKILRESLLTVHLVGNIGAPALDELDKIKSSDVVVYELSSFQLWDLKYSPHVAVVLMVEPEHLDIHADVNDYVAAKSNIVKHQTAKDIVVYRPNNLLSQQIATTSRGIRLQYMEPGKGAHIDEGVLKIDDKEIINTSAIKLIGKHNLENICAAVTATWQFVQDAKAVFKVLSTFKGLKHRLQLVYEFGGVKYYDDSIGTTPSAALGAIHSFKNPKIVIMGGSSKGHSYKELARKIAKNDTVKTVITLGQEVGCEIAKQLKGAHFNGDKLYEAKSMDEAVSLAKSFSRPGDVVLLAPAAASFDLFKNYQERGDQFIKEVTKK